MNIVAWVSVATLVVTLIAVILIRREDGSSEKPSEEHFSRGVVRRYDRESECPECGYKAGVDELFCPRCGYEFKKLIRRNVVKQWSAMR